MALNGFKKFLNFLFGIILIWFGLMFFVDSLRLGIFPEDAVKFYRIVGFVSAAMGVLSIIFSGFNFLIILLGFIVIVVGLVMTGYINVGLPTEISPIVLIVLGISLILIVFKTKNSENTNNAF